MQITLGTMMMPATVTVQQPNKALLFFQPAIVNPFGSGKGIKDHEREDGGEETGCRAQDTQE